MRVKSHKILSIGSTWIGLLASFGLAQDQSDPRTLLPPSTLKAIAHELSGAQAFAHVVEMTPYERNRPPEEYGSGTYREAAYMAAKAREYGFSDVKLERFPQEQKQWDAEMAELWIEKPVRKLVTRYRDLPATLATGSETTEVTAELVYIGSGDREDDYAGKDVKGKIVLASGPVGAVHDLAVRKYGAAGVATFHNRSGEPVDRPDQIPWSRLARRSNAPTPDGEGKTTFGFILSHRMGMELLDLFEKNASVIAHAKVKTAWYPAEMQVVVATIPGDGTVETLEKTEVVFIAHLFEGIAKQGANDNSSGTAVQLELGRTWLRLIEEGKLPPPKRTVRFLWVPEIVGTRAYLARHPDLLGRLLGAINMDMVGANQTHNKESLNVVTTPHSLPSFVNDLAAQFMEYVGDTNRAKVTNRGFGYRFRNPIFDPKGSRDPFWYHVETFSFGSDHQVFTEAEPRVPAVAFNNFHDAGYHTSEDTPRFLDPTQMKRAGFIGLAMGQVMAHATGSDAVAVATLSAAYGQRRLGEDLIGAVMMIAEATTGEALHQAYKEARSRMQWAHWREKAQVHSAATMIGEDTKALEQLRRVEDAVAAGENIDLERVKAAYLAKCTALDLEPIVDPPLSAEEREADRLIPKKKKGMGPATVSRGDAVLERYYDVEARHFADGSRSILDVRNAISAEFGPVALEKVVAFFRALEESGTWTIETRDRPR
jgi:hypothetical protein